MIRAVIFDVGGVLLSSPLSRFADYERRFGLPPNTLISINMTQPNANAWARFERGEIDRESFVADFESEARQLGYELDASELISGASGSFNEAMIDTVKALKGHYQLAMLTNNFAISSHIGPLEQLQGYFDVVVESSKVGIRKPEPEIYRFTCEALGVDPTEAVFLDDLGINLKPARTLGMKTIKVTDIADAIAELWRLLESDYP